MSWFCEKCNRTFSKGAAEPRKCAICHAKEYAAELEAELDRMTEERDYWRKTAEMLAKEAIDG